MMWYSYLYLFDASLIPQQVICVWSLYCGSRGNTPLKELTCLTAGLEQSCMLIIFNCGGLLVVVGHARQQAKVRQLPRRWPCRTQGPQLQVDLPRDWPTGR